MLVPNGRGNEPGKYLGITLSMSNTEESIKLWIKDFVSVYNENIDTIPCPFAKQAMIDKKIKYKKFSNNDLENLRHQFYELVNNGWDDSNEVLILYADTSQMSVDDLSSVVLQFNNTCKHLNLDLVALEDHPDDVETINGVKMNFGEAILVLVQRLSKLTKASKILERQGYYKHWSKENLSDVVDWRADGV